MKKDIGFIVSRFDRALVAAATVGLLLSNGITPAWAQPAVPATAPAAAPAACNLPKQKLGSPEQTAWQLFVAINCMSNGKLTWETWTEQTCWFSPTSPGCTPGTAKKRFAQAVSLLATKGKQPTANAGSGLAGCQPMTTATTPGVPPGLVPFVPKNLSASPKFCEEVYVNASEAKFVTAPPGAKPGVNLLTNIGQATYIAATQKPLQFPNDAVEVKADWIAASSLNTASFFDCDSKKPQGIYVQKIDGVCYALVGIHISSKLYTNWLWATFEPQSTLTNPNRCNPALYSSCNDAWGSNPASSTGQTTALTKNVTNLMDQAGLAQAFRNYRLVGVQTDYNQPVATKGLMGNSFVEFNAQVAPQQASCITCHAYAAINVALNPPGQGVGGPIGNAPATGKPQIPPTIPGRHWVPLDFSWMLGFMPQGK